MLTNQPRSPGAPEALQACHDLELLLLGDLRQLLDEPPTSQSRRALLVILNGLLANLARQTQLKSAGGYMSEVLAAAPHWHCQVESLRSREIASHLSLQTLRNEISQEVSVPAVSAESGRELRHWMQSLGAHRRDECQLLQEAFTLDIGGEA